jgi:hypothetical protein
MWDEVIPGRREPSARPLPAAVVEWLEREWHLAGLVCAVILLVLTPIWIALGAGALTLVYLQLPIYQLHQIEEHAGDRFRHWVNDTVGQGREALTPLTVLVVNVGVVWGLDLVGLYLAAFVDLSFGLIPIYLALVNGLVHILGAIGLRRYNPGLVTGVVLFGGVGVPSLLVVSATSDAGIAVHVLGILVAVLVHVALLLHVRRRLRAQGNAAPQ